MRDAGPPAERPRQPGRIRSILLALAVHAAFFAFIVFGVSWQSQPTPPLEAELWSQLPPVKASRPPEPAREPETAKPEPPPPPPPPPKPEPRPEPKPEPVKAEPPRPDPAIAEKREREKKEKEKRERLEREKAEKADKVKKEEERRKREAEDAERKRKADEEKAKAAKAKAESEARAAEAQRAAAVASARQNEINQYRGRIRDKIRGRANVPDTVTGKPEVEVRITLLPGGEVLNIDLVKSSGNRIYDESILRAIRSASPLPVPPADSELFPQFRDLKLKIEHER